ncbi:MAG: FAD:protein FMN transferase [Desulfobulbaceae bacterium]|nr:FAD:protein FMN transferase [Desulfobulbaceae bacterium]
MRKKLWILIPALMILLMASACKTKIYSGNTFALDTLIELKIYQNSGRENGDDLIQESFDLVRTLEDMLSVHVEGSDIYNLEQNAGVQPTRVNALTYRVLQDSLYFSEITDGLFDITAGPLINLWAIDPPDGHYPSPEELDEVLPLIDYHKIDFLGDNQVELQEKGMIVNLGAIAKGTIADEVKAFLVEKCLSFP